MPRVPDQIRRPRRQAAARLRAFARLRADLTEFIRARMPWPFVDVDRDSDEAEEAASALAEPLARVLAKDFDDMRRDQGIAT